ncbi:selenium-dependent xanthine dehydrogenase, partial [Candidatus Poribacteria bacterium]|nr:selenium-dependent xanthine dehydrogenase [Candidatus Poribacteria bacterium]
MTSDADTATDRVNLSFQLNGRTVHALVEPEARLLDVLRDDFDIISPKNGCQPLGQCGCCTILVDDRPIISCVVPAARVEGKAVTTLEGLPESERQELADSFQVCGGLQCGFCIPGIAIRAKSLVDKNPECDRDEIQRGLMMHLCRCTGYKKIEDSIECYRGHRNGVPIPGADWSGSLGSRMPRYLGREFVLGGKRYIDDIKVAGMAFGA